MMGKAAHRGGMVSVVLLALLVGCGKPSLSGKVLDNFGQPIEGAEVSITNTSLQTTTDSQGRYSLGYVPGHFDLRFSGGGYTTETVTLDATTPTAVPVRDVVLALLPPPRQLSLLDSVNHRYIPINPCRAVHVTENFGEFIYRYAHHWFELKDGDPTVIPAADTFQFVSTVPDEEIGDVRYFLKVMEKFDEGHNNVFEAYDTRGYPQLLQLFNRRSLKWDTTYRAQDLPFKAKWLTVKMAPGTYIYVNPLLTLSGRSETRDNTSACFVFTVR